MNDALQEALACADEAYLVGMSNKGTYKRALKDLETADVSVKDSGDLMEVQLCGEVCKVKAPLWESSCSCPSRSVCRHLIAAIHWLRLNSEPEETEALPELDLPEEAPPGIPETLRNALQAVTPAQLKKAMGTQLKTLLPQMEHISLEESSVLAGTLPDGTAVRLLYPLEGSTCSCHRKELCPHKAAVIAAWQLREKLLDPEMFRETVQTLPEKDAVRIRESARNSLALLCDILQWGLVRMPENMADHLEAAAVQSHALRMADAERLLRDLSGTLQNARARRAVFRVQDFLRKLCETAGHLTALQTDSLTEELLGQFRRTYAEQQQDLTLLPIGQREVKGGDYEGTVYYFLNKDETAPQRFLTLSDLRPVFYEGVNARRTAVTPWNAGAPLKSLMRSELTLQGAKISDGKLSASKETNLVSRKTADLDCDALRNLIFTDFRKLAIHLAENHPQNEAQRLCFVYPAACLQTIFDTHAQQLCMTLTDETGNCIEIRVRYQKESKEFIQELESISRIMAEHPDTQYVWLCSAWFTDGKLTLFPIELYNFIRVPEGNFYQPPEKYQPKEIRYAPSVFNILQETEDWLCGMLQSGLQSAFSGNAAGLSQKAAAHGLQGFSGLLQAFQEAVSQYRHTVSADPVNVLQAFTALQQYITIGKQKLEVRSALCHMQSN